MEISIVVLSIVLILLSLLCLWQYLVFKAKETRWYEAENRLEHSCLSLRAKIEDMKDELSNEFSPIQLGANCEFIMPKTVNTVSSKGYISAQLNETYKEITSVLYNAGFLRVHIEVETLENGQRRVVYGVLIQKVIRNEETDLNLSDKEEITEAINASLED